ncbi:MAG: polyhydroxyalkanoic acid system family protein [Myxococcales bacterium]|jgi:regulation of enolase protein 1 (concanavalin A-like superfamily)|nr:polyhydroxyalkanoic acid system family protein [Myxococcales bacterium]
MKLSQKHSLDKAEAQRRVEKLTDFWKREYGVNVTWTGDRAHFLGDVKGIHFDAHVTVGDNAIDAEGSDPGLMIRAVATTYLKKKLADYLNPAKKLEDLEG